LGVTPLHWACVRGDLAVVQDLVAHGADLFVTAACGTTAFDLARQFNQSNVEDYLLHNYADEVSARKSLQAIHSILQASTFSYVAPHPPLALSLQVQLPLGKLTLNHLQTLLWLLPRDSFRSQDNNGQLPLHIACRVGAPLDAIRFVVEQDPNAVHSANNDDALPLHLLCESRPSVQAVQYLLTMYPNALIYMQEYYKSRR